MSTVVKRLDGGGETWNAAGTVCKSAEIRFLVFGAGDTAAAIVATAAEAPSSYNGAPLKEIRFDELNEDVFTISVAYEAEDGSSGGDDDDDDDDDAKDASELTESFDCGGGTARMICAYSQTRIWPAGGVDDAAGMIGWNGKTGDKAQFAGVDVPCADLRKSYQRRMKVETLKSSKWQRQVASLVGKVNASKFKQWQAGEALFVGCSYSAPKHNAKKATVTFNFRISLNESDMVVGGKHLGPRKGWEHLWSRSHTEVGTNNKTVVVVDGIYKAQVCKSGDFNLLGV